MRGGVLEPVCGCETLEENTSLRGTAGQLRARIVPPRDNSQDHRSGVAHRWPADHLSVVRTTLAGVVRSEGAFEFAPVGRERFRHPASVGPRRSHWRTVPSSTALRRMATDARTRSLRSE